MQRSIWFWSSILGGLSLTVCFGLIGCNSSKPKQTDDGKVTPSVPTAAKLCKELGRQNEYFAIREVLSQFAAVTSKTHTDEMQKLSQQQQELLEKEFKLSPAELEEVRSLVFRPMDGHYVESCLLMRDIVQQLDKATRDLEDGNGLEPFELAQFAFGWVQRQVLPGIAQGDDWPAPTRKDAWVPSHIVLRRGYGGPRDRALVFLELARQLQLQGFLFDSIQRDFKAGEPLSGPLVGLIHEDSIYLFDPVLGMPVPADGKNKGIATLADVLKKPALFEPLGISAAELARAEIVLPGLLSSLAPRMKMLEGLMQGVGERAAFFTDAGKLRQEVTRLVKEQTKEPKVVVGIGDGPGRMAPLRILYSFLPAEEGGSAAPAVEAKDARSRKQMLELSQVPFGIEQIKHNSKRILSADNPKPYFSPQLDALRLLLVMKSVDIMKLYTAEPRMMLLRGQYQPMIQRFRRIIEILNVAPNTTEAEFKEDLKAWVQAWLQITSVQDEKAVKNNINAFFGLDPVFSAVLDVANDIDPLAVERDTEAARKQQFPGVRPRMLTYVVLAGCCRALLDPQVRFCQAERAVEKAEALQVRLDSLLARAERLKTAKVDKQKIDDLARKAVDLAEQTSDAWKDAHTFLAGCVSAPISRAMIEKGLQEVGIAMVAPAFDAEYATFETLQRAWSAYSFSRMQLIRTKLRISQKKGALEELRQFDDDLNAMIKSESLRSGLDRIKQQGNVLNLSPPLLTNQLLLVDELSEPNLQIMRQRLARVKD